MIACPVSIGINSLTNPVVYFWRMTRFRKFVCGDISLSALGNGAKRLHLYCTLAHSEHN